jgi:NNP family nitrate/nitrite transporter-like MFS transporter
VSLKSFLRSGHAPTLVLSFLYFDTSFMIWVLMGVLGVHVAADFGLDAGSKGLLVALPILGGSLVRIPMGILVDRIGAKRTGLLGQFAVLAPLAWGWLGAESLGQTTVMALLLGVAGGSFAVALPLAGRWYPPEHQGLALGIAGAGNSGTVLTAFLAPRLAEVVGWRGVFGWALVPAAVTLVGFWLFAREAPRTAAPRPLRAYLEVWRKPDLSRLCLLYAFTFGGFVGLASFLVILFHDQYGMSRVAAGSWAALCVLAGSGLRPLGGVLADRLGGQRVLAVVIFAASLLLGVIALRPPAGAAVGLLMATLGFLGLGNGSVFQIVPQRFRQDLGAATGTVGAAGGLGGFAVPSLLGLLKGATGSYTAGLFFLSLLGAYALTLLAYQHERWSRAPEAVEASRG